LQRIINNNKNTTNNLLKSATMEKINSSEQLAQVITESGVEATTAKTLQDSFLPFFNQAQDWAEKASKLVVTSADQVQEMKDARAARLALKEIRVNADKARKLLKEDSLRYGRAVQGVYNVIEYLIVPIEQHLEKQENFVKIQEAEQKAKLKMQREDELRPYSMYVPFGIDLSEMTTENYQIILNGAKLQFEAAIEAKQRAEKERVERENAVKLHNERKNTIILFWSYLTDSQKALDFSTISENEFSMILENCKSQKAEYDKKQAEIKAENERLAGSSGLTNLTEFQDAQDAIQNAQNSADEAYGFASDAYNYASALESNISDLQSQIDGVVVSWFYPYVPASNNYPENTWTTTEEKNRHIGDTFTNTQVFVDNTTTPNAGKSWRYVVGENGFTWTPIADSDAVKALLAASKAQDTADGKRQVFVSQPTTAQAYSVGDLWTGATIGSWTNELLKCVTAKAVGTAFSVVHWALATKYTDDTAVNNLVIGGRNLIIGSSNATIGSRWSQNGWGGSFETYNGLYKLVALDGWHNTKYKLDLSYAGKTVTISFYAKLSSTETTSTTGNTLRLSNSIGDNPYITDRFNIIGNTGTIDLPVKDVWLYHYQTVVLNNDSQLGIISQCDVEGAGYATTWYIKDLKLELGNKATDYSRPDEDVAADILIAKQAGENAQQTADAANSNVINLNEYVDGSFKDGVIDASEAQAIDKLNKQIDTDYNSLINDYNVVYANSYLEGSAKSDLLNAKINLVNSKNALQTSINTAIADGATTPTENADVDVKFATYSSDFKAYQTALSNANKAIQIKLDSLSTSKVDNLAIGGRNLLKSTGNPNLSVANWLGAGWGLSMNISISENALIYRAYNGWSSGYIAFPELIGKQVTISLDLKWKVNESGANLGVLDDIHPWTGNTVYSSYFTAGDGVYIKNTATFVVGAGGKISLFCSIDDRSGQANEFYIKNLKLEIGSKPTDWTPAPEDVQAQFDDIASDNRFTPDEKQSALNQWNIIQGEYTRLSTQCTNLGVTNSLSTPYADLANYINPLLSSMTTTSDIDGTTFRTKFANYANAATDLKNALTNKVQANVDGIQIGGVNLLSNSKKLAGTWFRNGNDSTISEVGDYIQIRANKNDCWTWSSWYNMDAFPFEIGKTYTISFYVLGTTPFSMNIGYGYYKAFNPNSNTVPLRCVHTFTYDHVTTPNVLFFVISDYGWSNMLNNFQLEEGNKVTAYNLSPEDTNAAIAAAKAKAMETNFLKEIYSNANQSETGGDINGGAWMTNLLRMRGTDGVVRGGMSGLASDNVGNWTGGTYAQAIADAAKAFKAAMDTGALDKKDGSGHRAKGNFAWDVAGNVFFKGIIQATGGKIGAFDIVDGNIIGLDSEGVQKVKFGINTIPLASVLGSAAWLTYPTDLNGTESGTYGNASQGNEVDETWMPYFETYGTFVHPCSGQVNSGGISNLTVNVNGGEDNSYQPTSQTVYFYQGNTLIESTPSQVNISLPAGTYQVVLRAQFTVDVNTGNNNAYFFSQESQGISYESTIAQTEIGKDGFYSVGNSSIFVYFNQASGFKVKGATDIPAGLGGASINGSGGVFAPWGKISTITQVAKSGNNYTITHNIGDTNYSLILTPISGNVPYFSSKSNNTIVVTCAGGFDFILIRTQ
jgi:hypothetical protein